MQRTSKTDVIVLVFGIYQRTIGPSTRKVTSIIYWY